MPYHRCSSTWPLLCHMLALYPYVKNEQLYACPSQSSYHGDPDPDLNLQFRYGANIHFEGDVLSKCEHPAQQVYLSEAANGYIGFHSYYMNADSINHHNGGINICLVDGHAKWFKAENCGASITDSDIQAADGYAQEIYDMWGAPGAQSGWAL